MLSRCPKIIVNSRLFIGQPLVQNKGALSLIDEPNWIFTAAEFLKSMHSRNFDTYKISVSKGISSGRLVKFRYMQLTTLGKQTQFSGHDDFTIISFSWHRTALIVNAKIMATRRIFLIMSCWKEGFYETAGSKTNYEPLAAHVHYRRITFNATLASPYLTIQNRGLALKLSSFNKNLT